MAYSGRADFSEPGGPGFDFSSRQPQVVALISIEHAEFMSSSPSFKDILLNPKISCFAIKPC